ncbi:MAG: amidohydrolase, partial [Betaproteobacteria bacterium]
MLRRSLLAALTLAAAPAALPQSNLGPMIDAIEPQVIAWRRHVHENAELSFQEVKTAAYVAAALRAMPGIEVQTDIGKTPGVKAV